MGCKVNEFLRKNRKTENYLALIKTKKVFQRLLKDLLTWWALTDSNRRPSACKADALNQLS